MRFAGKILARISLITLALLMAEPMWAVAEVESRVTGGSWRVQDQSPPEGSSLDLLKKIEYLQQEVQELRGKVDEQVHTIQQLQESQKKLYADLDSRIGHPASHKSASMPAGINLDDKDDFKNETTNPASTGLNSRSLDLDTLSSHATPSSVSQSSPETIVAEEKAYQQAYRLIQKKDYEGAAAAFQALNQRFPQGKYLPNANYWLGEIYFTQQKYDLALKAFDSIYRQYPQHPKAADALLKMGYVAYAQGQYKRAETFFNKVKSQYPDSTSSQLADAKLSHLQHEGHI